MPIVLKETSGGGASVPPGTHLAVCYRIVDMGTQPDTGFGAKRKLSIAWEIPSETIAVDGKQMPMTISKTYAFSMNAKSTLRKDLAAWRGRDFTKEELAGFNMNAILGKACLITVETGENGRSRVGTVAAVMKGMTPPKAVHPLVEFSVTDGRNDTYKNLPEWLRKACDACDEWTQPAPSKDAPKPVSNDDDVAF
jgi:hypothetical protein